MLHKQRNPLINTAIDAVNKNGGRNHIDHQRFDTIGVNVATFYPLD